VHRTGGPLRHAAIDPAPGAASTRSGGLRRSVSGAALEWNSRTPWAPIPGQVEPFWKMPISATRVGVLQRTSVDSAACTGPEVRRARRRRAVTGVAGLSTQGPRWTTVPCPSGRESRPSSRVRDRHVHGGCARTCQRLHVGASTAGRAPCLRPTSTAARRWHTVRTRSRDEGVSTRCRTPASRRLVTQAVELAADARRWRRRERQHILRDQPGLQTAQAGPLTAATFQT
jgi:hypothetical protein